MIKTTIITTFTFLLSFAAFATNPKYDDETGGDDECDCCGGDARTHEDNNYKSIEWSVNLGAVKYYQVKDYLKSSRIGALQGSRYGKPPKSLTDHLKSESVKRGGGMGAMSSIRGSLWSGGGGRTVTNNKKVANRTQFRVSFMSHTIGAHLTHPSIFDYNYNGNAKVIKGRTIVQEGAYIVPGSVQNTANETLSVEFIRQVLTDDSFTQIDTMDDGFRLRIWDRDTVAAVLVKMPSIKMPYISGAGEEVVYEQEALYAVPDASYTPLTDVTFKNPDHPLDLRRLDIVKIETQGASTRTTTTRHTQDATEDTMTVEVFDTAEVTDESQPIKKTHLTYSNRGDSTWDCDIEREVYEVSIDAAGNRQGLVKVLHNFEEYGDFTYIAPTTGGGPQIVTPGEASLTTTQKPGGRTGGHRLLKRVQGYKDINGNKTTNPPTTSYTYVNSPSNRLLHGRLQSVARPDGSWEWHEYSDSEVSAVSSHIKYSSWKDVTLENKEQALKVTTVAEASQVTIITEIDGVKVAEEIQGNITDPSSGDVTRTVKQWDASMGEDVWLTAMSCRYSNDHANAQLAGRLKWMQHPDGTFTVCEYGVSTFSYGSFPPGLEITSSTGAGSSSGITDGVKVVTSLIGSTTPIKEDVYDIASSKKLSGWEGSNHDNFGRPQRKDYDDNTFSLAQYSCCGVSEATTRQGEILSYLRDPLKRVRKVASRKSLNDPNPVYTTTTYNGLTTSTVRSAGDLTLLVSETSRSLDGLTSTTISPDADENNTAEVTTRVRVNNPSGGQTTTVTYPDFTKSIVTTFIDGSTKSSTDQAGHTTSYDKAIHSENGGGLMSQTTAANGSQWIKTYKDSLGRIFKTEYPGSAIATQSYNPTTASAGSRGKLATTTDPDENANPGTGTTISYDYNARGERTTTTEAMANGQTRITLTHHDDVSDADVGIAHRYRTWVNGLLTSTSLRSSDGYRSKSTSLAGTSTSTSTTPADGAWTVTSTTADGQSTVQTYTHGRLQRSESFDNSATPVSIAFTTYIYDSLGRPLSTTDSRTGTTTIDGYLENGAVTSVTTNGGADSTTYTYDQMGRRLTTTLPDNSVTYNSYTDRGQVLATWGSQTYARLYQYDAQGRMSELRTYQNLAHGTEPTVDTGAAIPAQDGNPAVPATYASTQWLYDTQRGWLTEKNYNGEVDNGTTDADYTYTLSGRLATRTWERGVTTTYTYDQGSLDTVDYSDVTPDVSYTYDNFGRPATVTQAGNTHTYAYDAATLVLDAETIAYDTDADGTADFTRILDRKQDALLRPSGLEITGEYAISYGYDTAGRLSQVHSGAALPADPTPADFTYAYKANSYGLVDTVTGPAHTVTNTYEANRNVLTNKENKAGVNIRSNFTYTVNNLGQRTALTTSGTAFSTAPAWAWSYNGLGELVEANDTSTANNDRAFQYDGIGNRQKTANGLLADLPANANYTANGLNQYTAIGSVTPSYDTDGNATSYPLPVTATVNSTLVWDAENRLIEVKDAANTTLATYSYDYLGRRIQGSVGVSPATLYIYDGWNVIADYTIQNSTFTIQNSYTWGMDLSGSMQGAGGVGGLLAVDDGTASYYPTYDGNGNVSEYLDSTGAVQAHYEYDAFGNTLVSTGTKANDFAHRFSTKPLDAETALYYYGYRYYDPTTGRWPSRDPIEEDGGMNLYGFVGNDGINWVDVLGLHGTENGNSTDKWQDSDALSGADDDCCNLRERSFRIYNQNDKNAERNTRGLGVHTSEGNAAGEFGETLINLYGVNGVSGMIEGLGKLLGGCDCIKSLVIMAHGTTSGGFILGEGSRVKSGEAEAFAKKIKAALCPNATITLLSCWGDGTGANAGFANDLATHSGADVVASKTIIRVGWKDAHTVTEKGVRVAGTERKQINVPARTNLEGDFYKVPGGGGDAVPIDTPYPRK